MHRYAKLVLILRLASLPVEFLPLDNVPRAVRDGSDGFGGEGCKSCSLTCELLVEMLHGDLSSVRGRMRDDGTNLDLEEIRVDSPSIGLDELLGDGKEVVKIPVERLRSGVSPGRGVCCNGADRDGVADDAIVVRTSVGVGQVDEGSSEWSTAVGVSLERDRSTRALRLTLHPCNLSTSSRSRDTSRLDSDPINNSISTHISLVHRMALTISPESHPGSASGIPANETGSPCSAPGVPDAALAIIFASFSLALLSFLVSCITTGAGGSSAPPDGPATAGMVR